MNADPLIKQLREQISEADRTILDALNTRLELVAQLKRHKESRGLDFLDPDRESWMLTHLRSVNRGPLTDEGVEELLRELLDLTKREVERSGG